jgi:hypothetical protein
VLGFNVNFHISPRYGRKIPQASICDLAANDTGEAARPRVAVMIGTFLIPP